MAGKESRSRWWLPLIEHVWVTPLVTLQVFALAFAIDWSGGVTVRDTFLFLSVLAGMIALITTNALAAARRRHVDRLRKELGRVSHHTRVPA